MSIAEQILYGTVAFITTWFTIYTIWFLMNGGVRDEEE